RTVADGTGSGDGTIRLDLNSSGTGIQDTVGNAISGGFTGGQVITIDKSFPTVLSINRVGTTPTNAASVQWTVTFSESVTGVNTTDFSLANTGLGGTPAITGVTGSGTT